jgi:hypothetical protein
MPSARDISVLISTTKRIPPEQVRLPLSLNRSKAAANQDFETCACSPFLRLPHAAAICLPRKSAIKTIRSPSYFVSNHRLIMGCWVSANFGRGRDESGQNNHFIKTAPEMRKNRKSGGEGLQQIRRTEGILQRIRGELHN